MGHLMTYDDRMVRALSGVYGWGLGLGLVDQGVGAELDGGHMFGQGRFMRVLQALQFICLFCPTQHAGGAGKWGQADYAGDCVVGYTKSAITCVRVLRLGVGTWSRSGKTPVFLHALTAAAARFTLGLDLDLSSCL